MPMTLANASANFVRIARATAIEPAAVSISAWVRRTSAVAGFPTAFMKIFDNGNTSPFVSYGFDRNDVDVTQMMWDTGHAAGTDVLLTATGAVPLGVWSHLVGTYDPAGAAPQKRVYVNGVLSASTTIATALVYDATATGDLYIGTDDAVTPFTWDGDIDDCRVYNRALSAAEILTMFTNRGADGIVAGLVGRWPLAERASGTTASGSGSVVDISESRVSGTPTASPVYTDGVLTGARRACP